MGERLFRSLLDAVQQPPFVPPESEIVESIKRQESNALSSIPTPQSPEQATMLEACQTGELLALQTVFQKHGVHIYNNDDNNQKGKNPPWLSQKASEGGPLPLSTLITAGVLHRQYAIVSYLLAICILTDGWYLWDTGVMYALLHTQDLAMLDLLRASTPDICAWEFNYTTTFLTEACLRGPGVEPLVDYLLDHSAAVGVGFPTDLPLDRAIRCGLSMATIGRMAGTSGRGDDPGCWGGLTYMPHALRTAIRAQRWDATLYFLQGWRCGQPQPQRRIGRRVWPCASVVEEARQTQNATVVAAVESRPCWCGERGWATRHTAALRLAWLNFRASRCRRPNHHHESGMVKASRGGAEEEEGGRAEARAEEKEKMLDMDSEDNDDD